MRHPHSPPIPDKPVPPCAWSRSRRCRGATLALIGAGLFAREAAAQDTIATHLGSVDGHHGFALSPAGDLDGDGYADIAVGAPREYTANGTRDGRVYVLSGRALAMGLPLTPIWSWDGPINQGFTPTRFGWSIDATADVDRDGTNDIAIGAAGDDSAYPDGGSVFVYSGATGNLLAHLPAISQGAGLGYTVAYVGDYNLDGYVDIAAGAPIYNTTFNPQFGRCYVFSGEWIASTAAGTTPSTPQILTILLGAYLDDDLGHGLVRIGDLDQDGLEDFALGAPAKGSANGGYALVVHGGDGATMAVLSGATASALYGVALAGLGDVNGDGVPDLAIGAPGHDGAGLSISDERGLVEVVSGEWIASTFQGQVPTSPRTLWQLEGERAGANFGKALARTADLDRDGVDDLLVGAPQYSPAVTGPGWVDVLSGRTGAPVFRRWGDTLGDLMGFSLSAAGDTDGDGSADLALGAPYSSAGGNAAGYVRFVRGLSPVGSSVCSASANSTGLPARALALGSASVSLAALFAGARSMPAQQPCLVFAGTTQVALPLGNGLRCIGAPILRIASSSTSPSGEVLVHLPAGALVPGTTLYVQTWFADPAGGAMQVDLSDVVRLDLTP